MKLRFLIFILATVLAAALVSCAELTNAGNDIAYEIGSPTVVLHGPLFADDLVTITHGSAKVSTSTSISTSSVGVNSVVVTVTPKKGSPFFINCSYTVVSPVIESIALELGDELPQAIDFIDRDLLRDSFGIDDPESFYDISFETEPVNAVGNQKLSLRVGTATIPVTLSLTDSKKPTAEPISMVLTNGMDTPTPESFVRNVTDESAVSIAFAEEYDFSYPHDFDVSIILTDESGNSTVIVASVHCLVDTEAPVITIDSDLYVTLGKTVSYKHGLTVTDNAGEPSLKIDNSSVDLHTKGEYSVTYTAVDGAGNETTATRRLFVVEELPPDESEVLSLAENIYNTRILTREGMTKFEIARAIYDWCYHTIIFDMKGTDRTLGPIKLAYDGFTTLKGDCYTYMITAKYLFLLAGIPTVEVTRLRHEGESHHFWLLVDVGDGWYHFDATSRSTGRGTDTFMLTDTEIADFCTRFNVEHYFRFDHDAYPERSTVSYFN